MGKIVFDFTEINNEKKLYDFLEQKLNLSDLIHGEWGRNLPAFWDLYSFGEDDDFFELRHSNAIPEGEYKELVKYFTALLERLKGYQETSGWVIPNPNFDYKVLD